MRCNAIAAGATSTDSVASKQVFFYTSPRPTLLGGWFDSDRNLLWSTSVDPRVFVVDQGLPALDFAGFQATTKLEAASQYAAFAVKDPTADLGSYHASIGGAPDAAALVKLLRERPPRVWGPAYRMDAVFDYYAEQYAPTSPPLPGCARQGAARFAPPQSP